MGGSEIHRDGRNVFVAKIYAGVNTKLGRTEAGTSNAASLIDDDRTSHPLPGELHTRMT